MPDFEPRGNVSSFSSHVFAAFIVYLRQRTLRRETGRAVKFIERQSLAEFQAAYASLTEIAKSRRGYRAVIKVELETAGLAPIFEPEGFIARFYRRSDLIRAGIRL